MTSKFLFLSKGHTDVGSVRPTNQDSFHIDTEKNLFIVADGMGGHAGGEIASKLCITNICSYLDKNQSPTPQLPNQSVDIFLTNILAQSINHASARIYEHALENPSLRGMGTTATVLTFQNSKAYWGHVGDSRLYLIRKGYQYQLTSDHSLVDEQVRAGILTEEEAKSHHLRNVITRSVGYQEDEDVDTSTLKVEENDLFVLCSDGLYGKVSDQEISQLVQKHQFEAIPILVELANNRGGEDNITVIIVQARAK